MYRKAYGSSIWAKIALGLVIVALILHVVGFATAAWMIFHSSATSIKVGLWSMTSCVGTECAEGSVSNTYKTGSFTGVQVLATFALVFYVISSIIMAIYVFCDNARGRCCAKFVMVMCFGGALFGLIGMAVWLAYIEYPYQAYWSLGLTVLAFTLAAIAGFLLIPDLVQNRFGERLVESRVGTYDDRMTPPTPRPRKVRSHRNFEQDRRYQTSRMYPEKKHPSLKNYPTEKLYPAPRPKHLYDRY